VVYVDVATEKKHRFQDLRRISVEIGCGLRNQWTWQKGDVMVTFSPNSADIGSITLGTQWAGGVVCPVNNLYKVGELASLLKSSGAKALATDLSSLDVAREAALIVGLPLNRVILIGDPDPNERAKHISSLQDSTKVVQKVSINPKEDLAFLVYSSGTTGLPKGVMLSHENIVANILQSNEHEAHMTNWRNDSMISFLPMFHIYGELGYQILPVLLRASEKEANMCYIGIAAVIFGPVYLGTTMHIMQRFNLEQLCQSIQANRITIAYLVPPVVLLLAKHPIVDKYNLSSLRMMHSAAAPLTNDLIEMAYRRLKVPIRQAYGISEASPNISSQVYPFLVFYDQRY
jgi:4-coumarate--CoA ligase